MAKHERPVYLRRRSEADSNGSGLGNLGEAAAMLGTLVEAIERKAVEAGSYLGGARRSEEAVVGVGSEGEEVISLRLAVPAVLVAAALAGCFTYFVSPPLPVEADQQLPPAGQTLEADMGTPTNIDRRPSTRERVAAFELAAEAILKQATADAKVQEASARTDKPAITRPIPLPKSRPIPRQ